MLIIPSSLIHAGENVLSVRLAQPWRNVQVQGDTSLFWIKSAKNNFYKSVVNDWKSISDLEQTIQAPKSYQGNVSYLYNGMVSPVIPNALKGIIWSQGESNAREPDLYEKLFQQLIIGWRRSWLQGDLPFLFVQASNIELSHHFDQPDDSWSRLREAQKKALKLPKTGMVISLDIGDPYDVHPKNKKDFGHRLVL